jgi:hypothetical protein
MARSNSAPAVCRDYARELSSSASTDERIIYANTKDTAAISGTTRKNCTSISLDLKYIRGPGFFIGFAPLFYQK